MVKNNELLEHAPVFDHFYGTPRAPVEAALSAGRFPGRPEKWDGRAAERIAADLQRWLETQP